MSEDVTRAFSQVSTSKIVFMQRLLLDLLALDVLVFLAGTYLGRRYISKPIQEIKEIADNLAADRLDVDASNAVWV